MAKLKELNPGFDGKETHVVARDSVAGIANNPPRSGGLLTELSFSSVAITNIVPVKALTGLKKLTLLPWTKGGKSALADLTPLAGLPLTFLACGNSQVSDLAPLRGMPLTILSVDNTPVSDLSPLAGMPLTILWCDKTKVTDLSPIAGAPLVELRCDVKPEHAPLLASIPTLRKINDLTPAALWMRMGIKAPVAAVYDRRNVPGTTTDGGHRPPLQTTTTTPDQGTGPATFKPGTPAQPGLSYVTTIGMELCYIPSGEFLLGSTPEERAWALQNGGDRDYVKHEGDQPRNAAIKQGFWLGKTEVTVGQWKQFVMATAYVTDAEKRGRENKSWQNPGFDFKLKDNHPACCMSWNDAMAFCEWLHDREQRSGRLPAGYKIRLPTEAEWEHACRAGKQTKFWWGDTKEGVEGRLNLHGKQDGFEFVSLTDHYGARGRNKFGLADMLGNMQEWCLDEWDPTHAHEECYKGNPSLRVQRGGSFTGGLCHARCAFRYGYRRDVSSPHYGFRVAVGPER